MVYDLFLYKKKIKKILLIQPPSFIGLAKEDMNPDPPLGLAYIAAILEEEKYDVRILDSHIEGFDQRRPVSQDQFIIGLDEPQILQYIASYKPDLVGITSMFTAQRLNMHMVARIVKGFDKKIPVIVGGAHASSAPRMVLSDSNVDLIVIGEGENVIIDIIKTIESGEGLERLDGIAYRDVVGQCIVVEKNRQIENLDSIPFPARHLLPMEKYWLRPESCG